MPNTNAQDMIHHDFRLYIEGVQVPFESVHISQLYGSHPSAQVTLPPWPGLQDLGRNYAPKVHVFWNDPNFGLDLGTLGTIKDNTQIRGLKRDGFKQIFSGVVVGTSNSKQIDQGGGNQSITLSCKHPIMAFDDILLRFANQGVTAAIAQTDVPSEGSFDIRKWNINTLMIEALKGITSDGNTDSPHYVEPDKFEDLKGTPGIIRVMWNILKRDAERRMGNSENTAEILNQIYIPLIEKGLKFWDRMTGHPTIEEGIRSATVSYPPRNTKVTSGIDSDIEVSEIQVPGRFRTFIGDAAQSAVAISAMQSSLAGLGSPEANSFNSYMMHLIDTLEYDLITLASPISKTDGTSREYLMKPRMPFYYAPICNVLLPNLLDSFTVNNNYEAIPSRTVNLSNIIQMANGNSTGGAPAQQYTSPHSVRYSRAGGINGDLSASLNAYNNNAGKYEYGSGVKSETTHLPQMYNVLKNYLDRAEAKDGPDNEVVGSAEQTIAANAWSNMYPEESWPGAARYNPWSDSSGITGFNRLNFLYADHQFAMATAKARTAQASGVFNPYPIVGYPMDVVDPVPSRESYHGMCTSVSHTIHAGGSATTSYGIASATTFSELAMYNLPAVNPYLTAAFDLDEDFRIYRNPKAYQKACKIYTEVLGVGAAEPALLQDYSTGTMLPFTRTASSGCWTTNETSGFQSTVLGSLMLVARNITSLKELDDERVKDLGAGAGFIDIGDWVYTQSGDVKYYPNVTIVEMSSDGAKILTPGIDTESSPFLTY